MSNKAETLINNIKLYAGQGVYDNINNNCGDLGDKPTPVKQAKYVVSIMEKLPEYCNKEKISEIMQSCGFSCISASVIEKAKKLYADSSDISEFLGKLNQNHIGGGKLHIERDKIIGIYEYCYCGLAKTAKNLSPDYCNCSAGWFKKLFSAILDKDIVVKKQKTILGGANECVFEIFAL